MSLLVKPQYKDTQYWAKVVVLKSAVLNLPFFLTKTQETDSVWHEETSREELVEENTITTQALWIFVEV